jgi:hypothetical protein
VDSEVQEGQRHLPEEEAGVIVRSLLIHISLMHSSFSCLLTMQFISL